MFGFKLVHRMIFVELLKVFSLTLVGLTSLLLLAGLVTEASQHGMSPGQILSVIPLLLPNMMPYTLPTTTLFATCIVYGRLAADNEILAIKAAGVHIVHVIWPAVLLGLGASTATAGLYYDIIPSTHHMMRQQVFEDIEEYLYSVLRKDGRLHHPKINYTIDVSRVEGKTLRDAQFRRMDPKTGLYDIVARAEQAQLSVDTDKNLLWVHMRNCRIINENGRDGGRVDDKAWPVELPADFNSPSKQRPTDMTWHELDVQVVKLHERMRDLRNQIQIEEAKRNHSAPDHVPQHLQNLYNLERVMLGMNSAISVEKHMRPALAAGCMCFVLVGCPVGIWFSKNDFLSAFITCFLPIIILYYPILLSSLNMAKSVQTTPWIIWSANGAMLVIAIGLFRRLARKPRPPLAA